MLSSLQLVINNILCNWLFSKTKKLMRRLACILQISLTSGFIENGWSLISCSAFNVLYYVVYVEKNPAL